MMKLRETIGLLACTAVLFGLTGCNSGQSASSETGGTTGSAASGGDSAKASYKFAFVTNNASDFWTIARAGVEKADAEMDNVTVEFKIPGEGTAAEQRRVVDDLVAAGVDGIAISPVDPANQTDMLNSLAKQMPVVTQDSDAPDSDRTAYVGTDNVAAGHQAGEELKKALPNGGDVMVFVGMKDAQNAKDRFQGLKDEVAGSGINIIDIRTDETDRAKAKANVADTLVKYPKIAGMVGLWSYNGPAILNAVTEANKVGKVKIVCFDEEDETLAGVQSGAIQATVVQQPFEFGYQSMKLLEAVKEGTAQIPADKKIIVPTKVINKETVGDFESSLKKLRGK